MADERVGYGKPPKKTRWKKGQSGNPSGRPKGSVNPLAAVMAVLGEVVEITERGKTKRVTKLELLLKSQTASGIKGDTRAANLILSWCARAIEAKEGGEDTGLTAAQQKTVDAYLEHEIELRLAQRTGGK